MVLLAAVVLPNVTYAQEFSLNFDGDASLTATGLQLFALLTLLSLVPGLAIMVTCFPFIVTVLSILRQAIGLQQAPPNMLIVTLALFLTYFVMAPVFDAAWIEAIEPFLAERLDFAEAFRRAIVPFREFMLSRVDLETLEVILSLRNQQEAIFDVDAVALSDLLPSFLLSEISRAFQIGFIIYLPFLIIDLVVATILMSMGMMMVPPVVVSLPFKLAFFVVADGWTLVAESLVRGYL